MEILKYIQDKFDDLLRFLNQDSANHMYVESIFFILYGLALIVIGAFANTLWILIGIIVILTGEIIGRLYYVIQEIRAASTIWEALYKEQEDDMTVELKDVNEYINDATIKEATTNAVLEGVVIEHTIVDNNTTVAVIEAFIKDGDLWWDVYIDGHKVDSTMDDVASLIHKHTGNWA